MSVPDAITVALIGAAGGIIGGLVGLIGVLIAFRGEMSKLRSEEARWQFEKRPEARFQALERLNNALAQEWMASGNFAAAREAGRVEEARVALFSAVDEALAAEMAAIPHISGTPLADKITALRAADMKWMSEMLEAYKSGYDGELVERAKKTREEARNLYAEAAASLADLINPEAFRKMMERK